MTHFFIKNAFNVQLAALLLLFISFISFYSNVFREVTYVTLIEANAEGLWTEKMPCNEGLLLLQACEQKQECGFVINGEEGWNKSIAHRTSPLHLALQKLTAEERKTERKEKPKGSGDKVVLWMPTASRRRKRRGRKNMSCVPNHVHPLVAFSAVRLSCSALISTWVVLCQITQNHLFFFSFYCYLFNGKLQTGGKGANF